MVEILLFVPFIVGSFIFVHRSISIIAVGILIATSVYLSMTFENSFYMHLPSFFDYIFIIIDYSLLGYFAYQGYKHKHNLILGLASIQIVIFSGLLYIMPHSDMANLYIDKLSIFMYLLINVVGGIIVIYAIEYIKAEDTSEFNKNLFLTILVYFLGVMNFLVSCDNIEWFFLFFELTTLSSYLLIRFRMDDISIENSKRALWMNLIGGLALLVGILLLIQTQNSIYFTKLTSSLSLIPFGFIAVAALVKGAQLPFHTWLLGAMTAPTPVSAILHSATMVKIAPYLIIKISAVIAGTLLSSVLMLFGGFVFLFAALLSLNQQNFKLILAYSTISMLGLMILTASTGEPILILATLWLIFFHGISKALLFIEAGILEKVYHLKFIEDMDRLFDKAPITVFIISIGFMSIILPPFGAFIGKWLSIEGMKHILPLVFVIFGSIILTVLYFKVLGKIIKKDGKIDNFFGEKLPFIYHFSTISYVLMLFISSIFISNISVEFLKPIAESIVHKNIYLVLDGMSMDFGISYLPIWVLVLSFLFAISIPLLSTLVRFDGDRVKEYSCAEKVDIKFNSYYYSYFEKNMNYLTYTGIIFFVLVILSSFFK
jgi:ech hydrogenase subunit A